MSEILITNSRTTPNPVFSPGNRSHHPLPPAPPVPAAANNNDIPIVSWGAVLPQQPVVSPAERSAALNRLQESRAARSTNNNVIDLTGDSPPPVFRINGGGGRNRRLPQASGSGSGVAGPSGIRRSNSNVIVINSDDESDEDDEDVVVIESSYTVAQPRFRRPPVPPAQPPRNVAGSLAGRILNEVFGRRVATPPVVPPARVQFAPGNDRIIVAPAGGGGGGGGGRGGRYNHFNDLFESDYDSWDDDSELGSDEESDDEFQARMMMMEEEEMLLYGGGAVHSSRVAELIEIGRGTGRGRNILERHFGYAEEGFVGLMNPLAPWNNRQPKGPPPKKYGIKMSHSKKIEEGYSRDIIPPPELADTPPPEPKPKTTSRKRKLPVFPVSLPPPPPQTEPVCAGCLDRFLLAQNGEKKPWALKCGHVICGKCIGDAKMRCEEMKETVRKARWEMDVDSVGSSKNSSTTTGGKAEGGGLKGKGKGKSVPQIISISDDEEGSKVTSRFGPTRRSTTINNDSTTNNTTPYSKTSPSSSSDKGKGKGKEKSREDETGIEENWTCCPVVKCDGAGTDLLAKDGDHSGAFELFI